MPRRTRDPWCMVTASGRPAIAASVADAQTIRETVPIPHEMIDRDREKPARRVGKEPIHPCLFADVHEQNPVGVRLIQ